MTNPFIDDDSDYNDHITHLQKFSHQNCHKVATKFLTENEHLKLQFEGEDEKADALIRALKKGSIGSKYMDCTDYIWMITIGNSIEALKNRSSK